MFALVENLEIFPLKTLGFYFYRCRHTLWFRIILVFSLYLSPLKLPSRTANKKKEEGKDEDWLPHWMRRVEVIAFVYFSLGERKTVRRKEALLWLECKHNHRVGHRIAQFLWCTWNMTASKTKTCWKQETPSCE